MNVHFSAIVFYESETGGLATEPIRDVGVSTNISEQLFDVLPTVTKPFGIHIRQGARFKGFWLGESSWIKDPTRRISSRDAGRVLVAVQEEVARDGVEFFAHLVNTVPAYADLVRKAEHARPAYRFGKRVSGLLNHPLFVTIGGGVIVGILLWLLLGPK